MSTRLDLRQTGEPGLWRWIRKNLFEIIASALIIGGVFLYILVSRSIIANPWPSILWLTFFFRLLPLLIIDTGVEMLILKASNFSSRSLANRIILFLSVSIALVGIDLIILGSQGVVPADYSTAGGSIIVIIGVIAAIMAIPSSSPPLDEDSREVVRPTYQTLLAQPPSTKPNDIQQRLEDVKDIYSLLTTPETTVLALTGMSGIGKSVLAALVYREVEARGQAGVRDFSAASLWLAIEPSKTMADLAGTLFEAFGKKLPDLHNLTGQNIAQALFDVINTSGQRRLIVLDQFDLLVTETGKIRNDRHGVSEWLELLTGQRENMSGSRILLTCYSRPDGPFPFLQEYLVKGLLSDEGKEGIDLLRKQGVQGSEEDLKNVVEHCSGHPQTLRLLKPLLEARHSSLARLLEIEGPDWVWEANTFLDPICASLSNLERELLSAFAIYREAIPAEAAVALLDEGLLLSRMEKRRAIDGLARWSLLSFDNNTQQGGTIYQLHLIVRQYMLSRYRATDKQKVHRRAAEYYLTLPGNRQRGKREQMSDVNYLIESFWHYCQAGQCREAYELIEQEGLREDLLQWGRKSVLLELYHLLIPLKNWEPEMKIAVDIYCRMASVYDTLGYKEMTLKYYQEALNVSRSRDTDNLENQGNLLNDLSRIWSDLGKGKEAQQCADQALTIGRELNNPRLEGSALNNLGRASRVLRNRDAALDYFEQALALYEQDHNKVGKARILNNIGTVYFEMYKQYEDAQYNFEDALKISQEKVDDEIEARTLNEIEAIALNNLGNCYNIPPDDKRYLGDIIRSWSEAMQYYEDALVIRRKREDVWEQVPIINNLSQICQNLNRLEDSQRFGNQALEISQVVGDLSGQVSALLNLGNSYRLEQKPQSVPKAFKYYWQAWEASRKGVGYPEGEGLASIQLGKLCIEQSYYKEALACLLCAQQISGGLAGVVQRRVDALRKDVGEQAFEELRTEIEPVACQTTKQIFTEGLLNLEDFVEKKQTQVVTL